MTERIPRNLLAAVGIRNPAHPLIIAGHRIRRRLLKTDENLWKEYLRRAEQPRLHIGGGARRLEGWLNADIDVVPGVIRMDATQSFPFDDGAFEFVYAEHMIEHVHYRDGISMLQECYRAMRPGGLIRIVTPDLAKLAGLCAPKLTKIQEEYCSWFGATFLPEGTPVLPATILDAQFRMWGHRFIYDEATIRDSLAIAGFHSVERKELLLSDEPVLSNIEHVGRYPAGLLAFESMAVEARR